MATKALTITNPNAAGIDIGSEELFVSVDGETVERFRTFSSAYRELVTYLQHHGITTVAMEATGVYWISLHQKLESEKIRVCLVNGAHVKNIQGPKSDVKDCRWLQRLHSYGLLRPSFIPEEIIRQLRTFVRLRDDHISLAAQHVQHIQKALDQMNIKLHHVISQITGVSGLRVLEAIISGERSPQVLLGLCDKSIQNSKSADVLSSLEGTYSSDQLFALAEALDCWKFYQEKINRCDQQIGEHLRKMTIDLPDPPKKSKSKKTRHHEPAIANFHNLLMKLTGGNNPTLMSGIADQSLLKILAEVGTDVSPWDTSKKFASWTTLAPRTKQSGRRRGNIRGLHQARVGQLFRIAAQSLCDSKHNALGGFYRRLRGKKGPKIAMKALARKLAVMYYNIMKYGIEYVEIGLERYEKMQEDSQRRYVEKLARKFNLKVVPLTQTS